MLHTDRKTSATTAVLWVTTRTLRGAHSPWHCHTQLPLYGFLWVIQTLSIDCALPFTQWTLLHAISIFQGRCGVSRVHAYLQSHPTQGQLPYRHRARRSWLESHTCPRKMEVTRWLTSSILCRVVWVVCASPWPDNPWTPSR